MIKRLLLSVLQGISSPIPLNRLIRATGQDIFLPFYHTIGTHLPHIHHLYPPRSEQLFKEDLAYLLRHFDPISIHDLYQIVTGQKQLTRPAFFLSFDDGLREVYDIARPILRQQGIPASIFLNPDFVDNRDLMFRYKASLLIEAWQTAKKSLPLRQGVQTFLKRQHALYTNVESSLLRIRFSDRTILDELAELLEVDWQAFLREQQPYMSLEQIREMQAEGFTFGAHSLDHRRYYDWPLTEQLRQTTESMDWVLEHLNPTLNTFAFPFTDHLVSTDFFEKVLGEPGNIDLSFGGAGLKKDIHPRQLQRFPMEKTRLPANRIISAEYVYYLLKQLFGKNSIQRIRLDL